MCDIVRKALRKNMWKAMSVFVTVSIKTQVKEDWGHIDPHGTRAGLKLASVTTEYRHPNT